MNADADRESSFPSSRPSRGVVEAVALMAGTAIAAMLLIGFAGGRPQDFGELALGPETQSYWARIDGIPVHCSDLRDAAACIEGHRERGNRPVVLWFGNSQLHAINQRKPDDETAPPILFRMAREQGLEVLAFSQPNANPQEHLLLFAYLAHRLPIQTLILPLVFDDFRETGIRDELTNALAHPAVVDVLERSDVGRTILANNQPQETGDLAALKGTVQQRTEAFLNEWLDSHWRLWHLRPQARGALFNELYYLRNTAFGISAQTKRRSIPGRFDLNLAAAAAILQEARERGVRALVYVVPLRNDVEPPYVASEYADFKQRVEALAQAEGATFANLESLVPARYWGQKSSTQLSGDTELDFMHFQGHGHVLLAHAIADLLERQRSGVSVR